ncbi:MAG: acyl-CoA dehydrogenase family protein [Syntrophomonadaceae bacterium]|jgi:alkylation response protein AidB-like acyl-CoA dehydrogenase
MTFPDRNNSYNFDPFLEWRKQADYYADDPFIQKVVQYFTGNEWEMTDSEARAVSKRASFRWRDMAETIAWPENRPYMMHYDGHKHRIDRIVRPLETEIMEREIFSEALFSEKTSPWVKLIKMFIIYQNGEACVACPLTCTEGMVEILKKYADRQETLAILRHCQEGDNGKFAIGAQYLSEIQGGSDVPANLLEAVQEEGEWRLYGNKFFCSATHADYALVTAKPAGSEKVALFVVPSWLPGNKQKEIRNGYTIDRIKWKMGTSELTTAEITFNGALAYPVGPLDRGVANIVGVVLTYSRLTVGLSAAAFMTRAIREAQKYAEFRQVFGMPIAHFPLAAGQLQQMEQLAKQTVVGAFEIYKDFMQLQPNQPGSDDIAYRRKSFEVRELIMLQKITASWDSTDVLRTAMSIFGGHGVMEDFSSLPRLYRDSAVNELWEGPRNVLLMQIHRDCQKAANWYPPREFIADVLHGCNEEAIADFQKNFEEILSYPDLLQMDNNTIQMAQRWDRFCHDLFHAFQQNTLKKIENNTPFD